MYTYSNLVFLNWLVTS